MKKSVFCIIFVLIFCAFGKLLSQNNNDSMVLEEACRNEEAFGLFMKEQFKKLNTQLPSWFFCSSNATYCGVSFPLEEQTAAEQQAILAARMSAALSQKEYNTIECRENYFFEENVTDTIRTGGMYRECAMTLFLPSVRLIKHSAVLANASVVVSIECDYAHVDTLCVTWIEEIRNGEYECIIDLAGRKIDMDIKEYNKSVFLSMMWENTNKHDVNIVSSEITLTPEYTWINKNIYACRNAGYDLLHSMLRLPLDYLRWTTGPAQKEALRGSVAMLWDYIYVDNTHFEIITKQNKK